MVSYLYVYPSGRRETIVLLYSTVGTVLILSSLGLICFGLPFLQGVNHGEWTRFLLRLGNHTLYIFPILSTYNHNQKLVYVR